MNNKLNNLNLDLTSPAAIGLAFDYLRMFDMQMLETQGERSRALGEAMRVTQTIPAYLEAGCSDEVERQIQHQLRFKTEEGAASFGLLALENGLAVVGAGCIETVSGSRYEVFLESTSKLSLSCLGPLAVKLAVESLAFGGDYMGWAFRLQDDEGTLH